jgi:hypothetical protein
MSEEEYNLMGKESNKYRTGMVFNIPVCDSISLLNIRFGAETAGAAKMMRPWFRNTV